MRYLIAAFALLSVGACATTGIEEPQFKLVRADGAFEIREYAPTIVAETTVYGGPVDARNSGFRPLADYIFANDRNGEKIAMTAPVTQAPRETIAMTAPVSQRPAEDGWTIGFTMPARYSMEELPAPASPDVRLVETPPRRMAVMTFSGLAGEERMNAKRQDLLQRIAEEGLAPVGQAVFAFYDPPWTLPFLRRNEVMIEVSAS